MNNCAVLLKIEQISRRWRFKTFRVWQIRKAGEAKGYQMRITAGYIYASAVFSRSADCYYIFPFSESHPWC